MNFSELNLHPELIVGLAKAGYETCTPVQEQVLLQAFEGKDLYVQSQTGTGKTAAFLTTVIQQMLTLESAKGKKALIMVPTRELAVQVEQEAKLLLSGTTFKTASFYGGVGYEKQTKQLKNGVDIIIGTPGRVLDLTESTTMDLSKVGFLVLDEADRMFDMGFYPDLRKLIKLLPDTKNRRTMLFSATLNTYVKNLAWEYTDNAFEITIEADNITVDEIDQLLYHVSSDEKMKLLLGILAKEKCESCIVFCNTKRSCEVVAKRLKINGYTCEFIIGDLPQSKRLQIMKDFKKGTLKCLVATDVAARGIDVDDLELVVNYDLPNEAENYVHRIGRTARAGKSGKAFTFCSEQDVYNLPSIERYIEKQIPSTMPEVELFVEDKSCGMYIKTDSYHHEGDDRRERRDNRNSTNKNRTNNSGSQNNYSGKPKNNTKKRYNEPKKQSQAQDKDLSKLSFDERMAFYKEKYGSAPEKANSRVRKNSSTKKNNSYTNTHNNKKNIPAKSPSTVAKQSPVNIAPKKTVKKGVLATLKGLFSKR